MSSSKKLTCTGTLRHQFICLMPRTPYPLSPLNTVYVCTYTYSHREWGRVEPERWGEGQQFTKLGRKYQHDQLYLQSINSDKHLPQSPISGQFIQMTTFCFGVYKVN
jgi:hypothetical protein